MIGNVKGWQDEAAENELENQRCIVQMKCRFGENSIASKQRFGYLVGSRTEIVLRICSKCTTKPVS